MTLLLTPKLAPPDPPKTRNRVGIRAIIWRNVPKGTKVTLDEAIALLRANW